MNSIHIFRSVKFTSRIFYPRYYALCSNIKQHSMHPRIKVTKPSYLNVSSKPMYISNCSSLQKKDSDSISDKNKNEKMQKMLDDEEFQNILKDFASDFGVDNETNELLDDIRKNIEEDYDENSIPTKKIDANDDASTTLLGGGLDHKYKEFSDADSTVIHSYEDNNNIFESEKFYHIDQELKPRSLYNNLKRGINGVFDLDDLIKVLRNESLLDITTILKPTNTQDPSSDFFVLVTAKSQRHAVAVTESLIKLYKQMKHVKDPFLKVEGTKESGWSVIDMGNIVLHIFLEEIRAKYDIESCQLLDLEFDSGGDVEADPMLDILEEQMEFFNSLHQEQNSPDSSKDVS